jgi:hypothetical protein
MSTEQSILDSESLRNGASDESPGSEIEKRVAPARKARQRSVFLFPAYGFTTALDIARRVEESGGGTLTEETLAVNMGLSVKSSGFRLKSLAARQFQLISKQSDTLTTTPVAKAIFKPTSAEDAQRGYRQSFLSIPLFQAVAERYRGQRLPDSQTLRNVLEREFHVEHSRVQQAERMLLDSARDAHLLTHRGDGTYLVLAEGAAGALEEIGDLGPGAIDGTSPNLAGTYGSISPQSSPATSTNTIAFTLDEIGRLEEDDFERVWRAIGILVRSRGGNRPASESDEDWDEE